MIRLYSKESVTAPLSAMSKSGRFVHSYILTGEKGTGRKTCALYIAMQLLCDGHNACGECRQCRRILNNQHPDLRIVERNSGSANYSVKQIREDVVRDSCISPNDCDRKVYILTDCEGWEDDCQDAMLKITEDPPEAAYFIFTGQNISSFLPTLRSRSMTLEVHGTDRESCMQALRDRGKYTEEQIASAAEVFGGNIGRCIDLLEGDEELAKAADSTKKAMEAIVSRDEYALAAILTPHVPKQSESAKRAELRNTLELLARSVRDGAVIRNGGRDILGCTPGLSRKLAERFSSERITAMYEDICEISHRCTRNCNAEAAAAVLAGRLCG